MNADNTKLNSSLENFKKHLDGQGFVSPMLSTLEPQQVLRRTASNQEIFGIVLAGDCTLVTDSQATVLEKHEIFFIEPTKTFEIQSGQKGVEYLFTYKK